MILLLLWCNIGISQTKNVTIGKDGKYTAKCSSIIINESLFKTYVNNNKPDNHANNPIEKDSVHFYQGCLQFVYWRGGWKPKTGLVWDGKTRGTDPIQIDLVFFAGTAPKGTVEYSIYTQDIAFFDLSLLKNKFKGKKIILNLRAFDDKKFNKKIEFN